MKFEITDGDNVVVCNLISTFKDEKTQIDYIIYTDNTTDENGLKNIYGSRYRTDGSSIELLDVENDYEWDLIDQKIRSIDNE